MLALRNATGSESSVGDPLMVMKFWLIVCGIYIWEYVIGLKYEWNVLRGHERYRWTIWIYSTSRLSCLIAVILTMVNFSNTTELNCEAWLVFGWVITALGCYSLASLLIVLRIFAIWERNKFVMAITTFIWVGNIGLQLSGVVNVTHAVWVPAARACINSHITNAKGLSVGAMVSDVTLLLIMLAGLLRLRYRDGSFIDIAFFLWKQGVVWLVVATTSQVLQVVFLYLNVNVSLKALFTVPGIIAIVIAGTRMYRDLTYYSSTPQNTIGQESSNLPKSSRTGAGTKNTFVHIPSNRVEVTVHKAYEEYSMSQMNRPGSYPSSDAQLADKPSHADLGLDDNV